MNFVKNFAEVSEELLEELQEVLEQDGQQLDEEQRELINGINGDLTDNLGAHQPTRRSRQPHCPRHAADGSGVGEARPADINNLLEEHARLAFHSARATNADFQLDIKEDLDEEMGELEVVPQDLPASF